jgi:SAM-dependent methyltransferase
VTFSACPVCGGDRLAARTVAGLALRRCLDCGVHLAAFAEAKDASYGTVDPQAYRESIGLVRQQQAASIVALVREHVAEGDWLDVGCGFGYAVDAARRAGYSARGVEPNADAAQAARERGVNVEHGTLTEATHGADVISTLDVLEHMDDVNAFARLVGRKARRLWVIKVPSSDGLYFRVAHRLGIASAVERLWQSGYEHPHRVYFNEASLGRFLRGHGFDVAATRYLQEIPTRTVTDRLTLDRKIPRWLARLAVPVVSSINLIEHLRARSDALLVLATPSAAAGEASGH